MELLFNYVKLIIFSAILCFIYDPTLIFEYICLDPLLVLNLELLSLFLVIYLMDYSLVRKPPRDLHPAITRRMFCRLSGGFEIQSGSLEAYNEVIKSRFPQLNLREFANLVSDAGALYLALRDVQGFHQLCGIMWPYFRLYISREKFDKFLENYKNFFKEEAEGQTVCWTEDDLRENQAGPIKDRVDHIFASRAKKVRGKWKLFKDSVAMAKLSNLVATLVAAGILGEKFNPTIGGLKMFRTKLPFKKMTVMDMTDVVIDSVCFFIEGGYLYFTHNDPSQILYGDDEMKCIDEEYTFLMKASLLAPAGNLMKLNLKANEYCKRLNDLENKLRNMLSCTSDFQVRRMIQEKMAMVARWNTSFQEYRLNGGLRAAPFGLCFNGGSSVGKSTVAIITYICLMPAIGYSNSQELLVNLQMKKYMDNYRSYINAVIFDDVANTRPEFETESPIRTVIDVFNNIPYYANMAEAAMKGKVSIVPLLGMATTNKQDLDARIYSNEPISILRRFNYHITVRVTPEYVGLNGGLDTAKATAWAHNNPGEVCQPFWRFDITQAVNAGTGASRYIYFEPVKNADGIIMTDLNIEQLLEFLIVKFKEHHKRQEELLANNKKMYQTPFCKACGLMKKMCNCKIDGIKVTGSNFSDPAFVPDYFPVGKENLTYEEMVELERTEEKGMPTLIESNLWDDDDDEDSVSDCTVGVEEVWGVEPPDVASFEEKSQATSDGVIENQAGSPYTPREFCFYAFLYHNALIAKTSMSVARSFFTNCFFTCIYRSLGLCSSNITYSEWRASSTTRSMFWSIVGVMCTLRVFYFSWFIVESLPWTFCTIFSRVCEVAYSHTDGLSHIAYMFEFLCRIQSHRWFRWVYMLPIPASLFNLPGGSITMKEYGRIICSNMAVHCFLALFPMIVLSMLGFPITAITVYLLFVIMELAVTLQRIGKIVRDAQADIRDVVNEYSKSLFKWVCFIGVSVAIIYNVAKKFQDLRNQSGMISYNPKNIDKHAEAHLNYEVPDRDVTCSNMSRTSKSEDILPKVGTNLGFFMCKNEEGKRLGNHILFMQSNVALVPNHMWDMFGDELTGDLIKHTSDNQSHKQTIQLDRSSSVSIPDTDLCLVYVPRAGSWGSLVGFLPTALEANHTRTSAYIITRNHNTGVITNSPCEVESRDTILGGVAEGGALSYAGIRYKLPFNTYRGLCMAPLLSYRHPRLMGFHLAGVTNAPQGVGGTITLDEYVYARNKLGRIKGVCLTKDKTAVPTMFMGSEIIKDFNIHPKSVLNELDLQCSMVTYEGTTLTRATDKSKVAKSIISDAVEKVTGVPNTWGPPPFKRSNWSMTLGHYNNISCDLPFKFLTAACEDYVEPFLNETSKHIKYYSSECIKNSLKGIKKLTDAEIINGNDGERFIDKIPRSTSPGFPFGGKKMRYMHRVDPFDYPNQCDIHDVHISFWVEMQKMEKRYLLGDSCRPIFKACRKDEPTPISKDKVRIFQASPLAFSMLVRKYFLRAAQFLSTYPPLSECAVGIVCYREEWGEMSDHICTFGKDRILAGDYSKYDLRMPAQVSLAAFSVIIDLCEASGNFSTDDISIMHGIAGDICYPTIAFDGDIISLLGSLPSGHNLTAYINSICNSLLLRCGLYSEIGICCFRDYVAAMTYGDDVKSSVKEGCSFSHITYAEFLKRYGLVFTMPDKSSDPTPYMCNDDADFLKRKDAQLEGLWVVGRLDESSIYKSLHCNRLNTASVPERIEIACQCINGALREWAMYGRDVFAEKQEQMKEVLELSDIPIGFCPMVEITYDKFLDEIVNGALLQRPDEDVEL
jgi:hypothetical protein